MAFSASAWNSASSALLVHVQPRAGPQGGLAALLQAGAGAARLPQRLVAQGPHEQLQAGGPPARALVAGLQLDEGLPVAARPVQGDPQGLPVARLGGGPAPRAALARARARGGRRSPVGHVR
jgi:hypothetical protein